MAYHLTHPNSNEEIEVNKDQIDTYLSQGWETKTSTKTAAATSGDDR